MSDFQAKLKQHRRSVLENEWHQQSLENGFPVMQLIETRDVIKQVENNADSFFECTADLDSPCYCPSCEKYAAESMAYAMQTYVPKPRDLSGEKVSDCCGEPDRDTGDCDSSYGDHGLCPKCRDHCEYVDAEEV